MAQQEAARDDGIDAVAIVTPNHVHHPAAKAFLEAGIHVICDKPMTTTVDDALDLVQTVRRTGLVFGLTHNYTGHPLVREARARVRAGELGAIRVVQAEYPQDWLTTRLEATGQKQAAWRTDPAQSGGGAIGDIGSHAYNLASFITGLQAESLCADLSTFVAGRRVDDNCNVLLRYAGRRTRHAVGLAGRARQRERAQRPRVRRQGRARVAAGGAGSAAPVPVRRGAADDHARRPRASAPPRPRSVASRPAMSRAISRRSPTSIPAAPS